MQPYAGCHGQTNRSAGCREVMVSSLSYFPLTKTQFSISFHPVTGSFCQAWLPDVGSQVVHFDDVACTPAAMAHISMPICDPLGRCRVELCISAAAEQSISLHCTARPPCCISAHARKQTAVTQGDCGGSPQADLVPPWLIFLSTECPTLGHLTGQVARVEQPHNSTA